MIVLLTAIILTTMKLLTRLCFDLSQLGEHKFKHSFQDCRNAIFNRGKISLDDTSNTQISVVTIAYLISI